MEGLTIFAVSLFVGLAALTWYLGGISIHNTPISASHEDEKLQKHYNESVEEKKAA